MEIVIATTTPVQAQQMQENLVGHTMSGEALEQRPMVQMASAADFLGAALRIYEITAIRLTPSPKSASLIDVWASYRPAIWHCEACGKEHSDYPGTLFGLDGYQRHFTCSDECKKIIQDRLKAEIQQFRDELAAITQHTPDLLGDVPQHILDLYCNPSADVTQATFDDAVKRWRMAKEALQSPALNRSSSDSGGWRRNE